VFPWKTEMRFNGYHSYKALMSLQAAHAIQGALIRFLSPMLFDHHSNYLTKAAKYDQQMKHNIED